MEKQETEFSGLWIHHQHSSKDQPLQELKLSASDRTSRLDRQIQQPPVAQQSLGFPAESCERFPEQEACLPLL